MASVISAPLTTGLTLTIPTAPTIVASVATGSLGNGNYSYKVTFVTALGESLPSVASSAVNPNPSTSMALSAIPTGNAFVTARKIYRTTAGGSSYALVTTIADNVTTVYVDGLADGSLGAAAPTINTASGATTQNNVQTFTNNLVFQPNGTGNTFTIANSVTPAASRTYQFVDNATATSFQMNALNVVTLPAAANTVVTSSQSGSVFFMPQATANNTITLPAPALGLFFKFIVIATADGTHTQAISSSGANVYGHNVAPASAAGVAAVGPVTTATLSATAANVKPGDSIVYHGNASNYFFESHSAGTASGWSFA